MKSFSQIRIIVTVFVLFFSSWHYLVSLKPAWISENRSDFGYRDAKLSISGFMFCHCVFSSYQYVVCVRVSVCACVCV